MKFINKIGVEFEGAFKRTKRTKHPLKGDGSVRFYDGTGIINPTKPANDRLYIGELASKPYSNKGQLKLWMRKYYPIKTNETCGYHIHVSFKNMKHRDIITNIEFHNFFLNNLKEWIKDKNPSNQFIHRINGGNTFCRTDFHTSRKYSAINYGHFETIEFRVFSQVMDVTLAQKCVDFVHDTVEKYLANKTSPVVETMLN